MRSVVSLILLLLAAANTAIAQPTMEEIRREYDAGKYASAISLASRALAARGAEAEKYDRYDLLYLRGEALLQLKQPKYAEQAFEEAFHATTDRSKKAAAVAMAALIRRSQSLAYVPKGKPNEKIDILDSNSRKAAMSALHDDLRAAVVPQVSEAGKGRTLAPIQALLPDMLELTSLEIVLTGDNKESLELYAQLGERARELISRELSAQRRFLEEANGTLYGLQISSTGNLRPRMLGTEDRKQLQELQDYVGRIRASAMRGRRIAQAIGGAVPQWESLVANADDLYDRVAVILTQGQ
jgi:hypothetical protein